MFGNLSNNTMVRSGYEKVLEAGFIPRRPFAHFFMNTEGIKSRIHLQNYYSMFFPDTLVDAEATVWLHDLAGNLIVKKSFTVKPFGQLYLDMEDIAGYDLQSEGMVYVDLKPPAAIRKQLKTIPNLLGMESNTPFWVSYRDVNDNYMYVHSIETYKGKVFGAIWPLNKLMERAAPDRPAWESWRVLDVQLLDELQIVAMNHSLVPGESTLNVIGDNGKVLWSENFSLNQRQTIRLSVPSEKIAEWKKNNTTTTIRVGLDPVFSGNGKPYVLMRYGGGPLSMHHG